jgi:hypothetical protein
MRDVYEFLKPKFLILTCIAVVTILIIGCAGSSAIRSTNICLT